MSDGQQPGALDRRAPFASDGAVGERGMRTRQRILDAALQVFDQAGFEAATVDQIAGLAGRSRVAIYQYFADKNHIFRELSTEVALQLRASLEALEPVTPDLRGWESLRVWLERHNDIQSRYRAVYRDFGAAAGDDRALASDSARVWARQLSRFEARVAPAPSGPRHLDATIRVLFAGLRPALGLATALGTALPEHYDRERIDDALADVFHRALFGPVDRVNVRQPARPPAPTLDPGAEMRRAFTAVAAVEAAAAGPRRRALSALLEVGERVIIGRGYLGLRVEDVIAAAGVSRGAFYKYFDSTDEYVRIICARAMRTTSRAYGDVPDLTSADTELRASRLRQWLEAIATTHDAQRTLLQVRGDGRSSGTVDGFPAGVLDWGRQRMMHCIGHRNIGGDLDAEALVLLGLLEGYSTRERTPSETAALVDLIEVGLLGHGT